MQHTDTQTPPLAKVVQAGLLFLSVTPLLFYRPFFYYHTSTKALFLFAVSEVVLFFLVWLLIRHSAWRPRWNLVNVALCLFILLLLTATILGVDPSTSFWSTPGRMTGTLLYLHLIGVFMAMFVVLRDERIWKSFFTAHVLVGLAVSVLHFFPRLVSESLAQEANGGSTLGNSSILGTYLLFLIAFATILAIWPETIRRLRWLWTVSVVVFLVTLFSTDAHAAQASVIGGSILWIALFAMRRTQRPLLARAGRTLTVLLAIGFLAVSVLVFIPASPLHETFVNIGGPTRFVIWDIALEGIRERPLLGWGPENFSTVFLRHYNSCLNSPTCGEGSWADRAHNIILDVVVESGILGLLAYLGIFAIAIRGLWKKTGASNREDAITVTLISLLVAYFVHNLTGFDSIVSLLLWVVVLAFCQWHAALQEPIRHDTVVRRNVAPILLAGILLSVAIPFFVVRPAMGFLGPSMSQQATDIENRQLWYVRAINLSPVGRHYRRSYMAFNTSAALWYATPQALGASASAAQKELAIAQAALQDTIAHTANDLRAHLMLARLYQVESRLFREEALTDARQTLERAVELNPRNPQPLWALTSVLLEQGDNARALETVERAYSSNPADPRAQLARDTATTLAAQQHDWAERLQLLGVFY